MAEERIEIDLIARDRGVKRTFDETARSADKAGASFDGLGKDSNELDARLLETRKHLKELIDEFEKTGDVTLFRNIRRDRSTISMIESIRKELASLETDAENVGSRVTEETAGSISRALSGLGGTPALVAGILAAVAAVAPGIGAIVGGAVGGVAGLGGIVGGVYAAAQDERIAEAGQVLGENFMSGFRATGRSFVNPLLDQMAVVQHAEDVVLADLAAGFTKLAPLVKPLAEGLEGLAENLNLDKVFADAQPFVRALANELPEIGSALSDMFTTIEDSDGSVEGFIELLQVTEDLIRDFGDFVATLSDTYDWLVRNTQAAADFGDGFIGWMHFIPGAGQAFDFFRGKVRDATEETHSLIKDLDAAKSSGNDWNGTLATTASNANAAAEATKAFDDGIRTLFGQLMGLEEAQVNFNLDLIKARKELKDGTKTLAINSEEGLKNRQVLDGLINDIERLREAHIAHGMSVERANSLYEQQIKQLIELAVKLGFDRTEVERFAKALLNVPKDVAPKVSVPGLTPALQHATALDKMFNELDGRNVVSTVTTEFASYRAGERNPSGHRAMGGPTMAGLTYLVGENGPELRTESSNGYVHSAAETQRMLSGASGGSSGPIQFEVVARFEGTGAERDLGEALLKFVRYQVRQVGGGSVQDTYGKPEV